MDLHFILILGHIIGTILGVGGATMIEVHLGKALKDGKMDGTERDLLGGDFLVTRIGMALCLITGLGFILEYALNDQLFRLDNGLFWAKMSIFVIIVINAYLLHKHAIGLYWGSAFSFVSWWTAFFFGVFITEGISFLPGDTLLAYFVLMALYSVVVALSARLLHIIRERAKVGLTTPTHSSS